MRTAAALLSLCFWLNAGLHAAQTSPKCGVPRVSSPAVHFLRVVGGTEAAHGSHPWLVSLQNRGSHFCGGSILTDRWIMTAAHCFTSLSEEFLGGLRVVAGEFDLKADDEEEQVFPIKSVSVHEKYSHAVPMNYDIALVELQRHIQMGARVQPICLPLPDENIPPLSGCVVGGWGRMMERGSLPAVLREVRLDLVEPARCKYVLQTVKSSILSQRLVRHLPAMTVVCAGPERGGRDACQGDSGGPLVCPAGSGGGLWVVLGVTSWGKGCGRSWGDNNGLPPSVRGSPGIFTDVRLLLPWIKSKLRDAEQQQGATSSALCSARDGPASDSEGLIRNPTHPGDCYDNNQLCLWSVSVPPGFSILLEFDHFHLENDSYCRYDRLTVSVATHGPVAVFCGSVRPGPVLLNNSQNASLLFSSDVSGAGSGFVIRHRAVRGHAHPGCGAVVLVVDQTAVRSLNYPQSYGNDCVLRWVVHAPRGHVVKLDFSDFDLEESDGCLYDSLAVLGDVEGTEEIGEDALNLDSSPSFAFFKFFFFYYYYYFVFMYSFLSCCCPAVLCGGGGGVPPPVLSYHSVMVLRFTSDSSVTRRGFRAALTFVSAADLHRDKTDVEDPPDVSTANQRHATSDASKILRVRSSSAPPLDLHTDEVDRETSEDPGPHVVRGFG
ncbi:ovochymase-2 [Brachyistius frenatus]|uniref:ovochymase-2 n=1 Tax=Brachyistius frenatus TaxID=100188 RepID=UPI0037E76D1B